MLVANARMYTVNAATDAAWRAWLGWVAGSADVPMRYEPHPAPAPLDALWARSDVGCALMCGYPLATWSDATTRPQVLAALVPASAHPPGTASYRTAIVARDDGDIASVDDTKGRRFAYTTPASQSGYQSVRAFVAERALAAGGRWFGRIVGPLVTPRGVVDAVLGGDADAGPLDGYWLDLLRRHEPGTAGRLRVIAETPWTPLPPFVCSASVAPSQRERIRAALLEAGRSHALAEARDALALTAVARAGIDDYRMLAGRAHAVDALGYPSLR